MRFLHNCFYQFYYLLANKSCVAEKQLAAINESDRELEKKDQALQAAKLRIKELEYARENYLEFQNQAKVSKININRACLSKYFNML